MNPDANSIRILAVDDHSLFRQGIAALVATQPGRVPVEGVTGTTPQTIHPKPLCPILCPLPNPTECDRVRNDCRNTLQDKASGAFGHTR